jgi:MFS transporter, CP family, cyanate transporter
MSRATLASPTTTVDAPVSDALAVTFVVLGLNLRPTLTSVGALLDDIQAATGMTDAVASVLVAVPMWCLAAGSWVAWYAHNRIGTSRTIITALLVLAATLATRPYGGQVLLLASTVLACLGIAVLTVLLPAIVQATPPHRRTLLFGCYAVALGTGSSLGALSPALEAAAGSWQVAAAGWAVLAVAALVAWRRWTPPSPRPRAHAGNPLRLTPTSTAWALTAHLGLTMAYSITVLGWLPRCLTAAGVPGDQATWMFWVAMTVGVPLAVLLPRWATRHEDQAALVVLAGGVSFVSVLGLVLDPQGGVWAWSVGIGVGMPAITIALQLIQLRGGDPHDTAALSSLVNGVGYAIAGAVSLGVGLLHAATNWHIALLALLAVIAGQIGTGMAAAHPATVRLPRAPSRSGPTSWPCRSGP